MTPLLAQLLMGWPAILGSLLVSVLGITRKRPAYLVAGAVLVLGFAWYLSGYPGPVFKVLAYALPLGHLLGALSVSRKWQWLAWPLLLPHAGIAAYLGAVVLSQRTW